MSALAPWLDPAAQRAFAAACVLLAYALLCAHAWRAERRRREQTAAARDALHLPAPERAPVLVAYASQTGFAEQIAWQSADLLHNGRARGAAAAGGRPASRAVARRAAGAVHRQHLWRRRCARQRRRIRRRLHGAGAAAAAVCSTACWRSATAPMPTSAASAAGSTAGCARKGRRRCSSASTSTTTTRRRCATGCTASAAWPAPATCRSGRRRRSTPGAWSPRRVLNPGSSGAPVCLLDLQPRPGVPLPTWEAGDLVQVLAPGGPRQAARIHDRIVAGRWRACSSSCGRSAATMARWGWCRAG